MPCERAKTHDNYHTLLNHGANTHLGLLSHEVAWAASGSNYTTRIVLLTILVAAVVAVIIKVVL